VHVPLEPLSFPLSPLSPPPTFPPPEQILESAETLRTTTTEMLEKVRGEDGASGKEGVGGGAVQKEEWEAGG
jgi:hypothetical protein